jgi:uncharacterized protein (DUF433 family)
MGLMDETLAETPGTAIDAARVLPVVSEHIGVRPGYCGGKPHILGHRIKVKHVAVWHERQGLSPAEIVGLIPTISLAQVHAALAYYDGHRAEIEAEIVDEERLYEELKAKQPPLIDQIRQRKAAPDPR